jgi:DnaJ-class molecular chaperone
MIKDYYEILGTTPLATPIDVCKTYKTLALQWHPERATGDKTTAYKIFCDISEAFDVLSDQERKAIYDRNGYLKFKNGYSNSNGQLIPGYQFLGNCEEIFENFFGTNNYYAALVQCDGEYENYISQKYKVKRSGPQDVVKTVKLTILDIFEGNSFTIDFEKSSINKDGLTTSLVSASKYSYKIHRNSMWVRSINFNDL